MQYLCSWALEALQAPSVCIPDVSCFDFGQQTTPTYDFGAGCVYFDAGLVPVSVPVPVVGTAVVA